MKRKFQKVGNSWALFLPKPILELIKIDPEIDEIEIEVNNKILTVKKYEPEF